MPPKPSLRGSVTRRVASERVYAPFCRRQTSRRELMSQSINGRRAEVARNLRNALGDDFVVIEAPDHPLVLRSVDVLAGGRAGLTAVIMANAEEVRRPKLLTSRVILNMVALPSNTNFVYLAPSGGSKAPSLSFAAELNEDDQRWKRELVRIVAEPQHLTRRRSAEKMQQRSESRFADTYRLARILHHRSKAETGQRPPRSSRSPSRDMISGEVEAAFFYGTPSVPALAHLTWEGAERWFDTPDGEPTPTPAPAAAAFVDGYPRSPGDPDKVLRAAAFAGWVLAPARSPRSVEQIGDLVLRYTRLG